MRNATDGAPLAPAMSAHLRLALEEAVTYAERAAEKIGAVWAMFDQHVDQHESALGYLSAAESDAREVAVNMRLARVAARGELD
jgi:hypothetical protein